MTIEIADVRARITTAASDDAVQSAIDAAYEAIADEAGAVGDRTEQINGVSGPLLLLSHPTAAVSAVSELSDTRSPVTLATDDYLLRSSGTILERLRTGTHPSTRWRTRVDVTYAIAATKERDRVAMALVELDFQYAPGVAGERIGEWMEQKNLAAGNYADERTAILATLDEIVGVY